ncbi:DUF2851 family protein [Aurantibacillus circumpalustris]|uniref:DUF2851 family protein n=1 Tax=Aurantibacillus circumpalustris TaxID=3036359 RepID=UPI00295AB11A|nr:DUF2851 family protein [Aurantibacillus circumpalustris]
MLNFNEELLQFIWRNKLLKPKPLISRSGNEVIILKQGELNLDAGPDFFNAQIKIDNIVLVGNVEIHIKTSDWLKHKHQNDKSYDTIILHAVYEHDVDLLQNTNNNVEVLELKDLIDEKTLLAYEHLSSAKTKLPCAGQLKDVNELKFTSWMERMTIERLEEKVKRIESIFQFYGGDYTQTFYTCLLRSFGFKVNAVPFELLAKQLPVQILLKHADNLLQLEALMLGVSGLLENQFEDKYVQGLQNEFEHLKNKYNLIPLEKEIFKYSKLRPANFPNVRLLQLAQLIYSNKEIFLAPQNKTSYKDLMKVLQIKSEGYLKNHYKLGGAETSKEVSLGIASIESLIINTFAPFFFFYSKKLGKPEYTDASVELLTRCKMESNAKTKLFDSRKSSLTNSAASQGIINLYDNYCVSRKCLKCGIAAAILRPE